jgi:hypothetical protein
MPEIQGADGTRDDIKVRYYLRLVDVIRKFPVVHSTIWRVRSAYRKAERRVLVRRPIVDGSDLLGVAITQGKPLAAGKMGNVEIGGLCAYLNREKARFRSHNPPRYSAYVSETLFTNAGVFPQNEEVYDRFGSVYLNAVKHCDALAPWNVAGEAQIYRYHCPKTTLIHLRSLQCYFSDKPWSASLEGKRVLVVSPFASTVRSQYAKRRDLWDDQRMLPEFELITIRAPLSAGIVEPKAPDWFHALEELKAEMDAALYDVALIGAGAFSLPLATHAKLRGKVGIHLGGALQILFGILGRRWENREEFGFVRNSWTRPSQDETPANVKSIENGCYW